MATVVVTIAAGNEAGATIRRFGEAIQQAAGDLPDRNPTGASVTMTIDNGPATGTVSVAIAGGNLAATRTILI